MSSNVSPRFRTWPITAVRSIEPELNKMGLKFPAKWIDGTSSSKEKVTEEGEQCYLSDSLVSVGTAGRGGTGSFISKNGLIITNWHVAYDAVRQASLKSNKDYLEDGYLSNSSNEDIPGPNYEVWITKSCVDVSEQVVSAIQSEPDPLQRANRVRDIMQEIAQTAQSKLSEGKRCDVQEMLANESYVLFTYERLRDVRIVYVPPKSLGNFGGDTDNFEWPRHTADFTLLRAYVNPEGEPADYSPENVPYSSRAHLKVEPNGAREGDMVFLLGFPGRTMRYAPTPQLQYANDVTVPFLIQDFQRKLELIDQFEPDSATAALKLGSSKKGLLNELKRSKGKLLMMQKLDLIQERVLEEKQLCDKSSKASEYLQRLSEIYDAFREIDAISSALEACRGVYAGSSLLAAGHNLHEYVFIEKNKLDQDREASYRERNLPFLCKRLGKRLHDVHIPHEAALIQDAIDTLSESKAMDEITQQIKKILDTNNILESVQSSKLLQLEKDSLMEQINHPDSENTLENDPFVQCAAALWTNYLTLRDKQKSLCSERDSIFAKLLDLQRQTSDEVIYPDCNGSLRISAGHVEGYLAADAVEYKPSTTLAGLYDKATEAKLTQQHHNQFDCPARLYDLIKNNSSIRNVPVCLLYSTDTVGGNSGSPVMNAHGKFVAINFDRQRQGLMNEYKWSKDYSRSIGVDVRYILWLVGEYDGASYLVDEMLS